MLDPNREVYPNAPLQYVACEVRYPFHPGIASSNVLESLFRVLAPTYPIVEPGTETTLVFGAVGAITPPADTKIVRFLSRDRRASILLTPTQLVVDTTKYERFEDFRALIALGIEALSALDSAVAGVGRIGLRYIDELRVSGLGDTVTSWSPYIHDNLLAPGQLSALGSEPVGIQGSLNYDLGDQRSVVMRYGALRGRTVGDAPLLPRRPLQEGPFFLLDIDSFWSHEGGITSEFDAQAVLDRIDQLHEPVRELFEASITERLRAEVLREDMS